MTLLISCSESHAQNKEIDGYLIFARTQLKDKSLGLQKSRKLTYFISVSELKNSITESINSDRNKRYLPISITTPEEELTSINIGLKNCKSESRITAVKNIIIDDFWETEKFTVIESLNEDLEYFYEVVYINAEWELLDINEECFLDNIDWDTYFMDYIGKPNKIKEIYSLIKVKQIDFDVNPFE